ncbi:MAG: TonB-dependent receptor [Longimicrobiales bacterium]|nr:TonB-dependent receptor [Longimicrobiales bacterium]
MRSRFLRSTLRRSLRGSLLCIGLLSASAGLLDAQQATGRIVGRVLNSENAGPVQSAQVFISELGIGALTSQDGRYVVRDVPAGVHDLQIQSLGFAAKTVTGLTVLAGQTATLDVQLAPAAIEVAGITVSAAAERGSTTSLLTERRRAPTVSDAIGRDQISRSPDGDAAAALRRVPGLTVVDGKYAYVRGLGERYSSTTLNDAPLASPEPDKKVIPLDLFPSGLLESIVTAKSYSPDQPGDYAGGLVRLRTRDFPANRIFSVTVGGGWNSEATFDTGLGYSAGESLSFLGFDEGQRALPAAVPAGVRVNSSNLSAQQIQEIGRSFGGEWGPTTREVPLNTSVSVTYGDDIDVGDDSRFGFIGSANYSRKYEARLNAVERVFAQAGVDDPEVDYLANTTTRSIGWGGLLNLTYQIDGANQVAFSGMFNHNVDDLSRSLEGFNLDSNTDQLNTRLQYIATTLFNAQLRGTHTLGFLADSRVEWRGAFTSARRYEPSTREVLYRDFNGTFLFDDFIQSGSVFHQDQDDDGWSGGLTYTLPLTLTGRPGEIALGVSTDRKDRDTFTRRFRFRPFRGGDLSNDDLALSPNELFAPENISPTALQVQESTFGSDNYTASQDVDAVFLKVEAEPVDRVRISGGVRAERSDQAVTPRDLFATELALDGAARLQETDLLPAVNVTLEATDAMNVRASYSRTLARPQLRELAPFAFADYAGGYLVTGNPTLERARISNYDVRWEWFPQADAVVAVSGFYKDFEDPIEALVLPSTELIRSWVNAPEATNYGVEIELRSGLGAVSPLLRDVSFNGNLTLVESEVDAGGTSRIFIPNQGAVEVQTIDRARALQGQSPYVLNLGLTWFGGVQGTSATLLFNRFGERIDAVGREASPDIFETARSQLDFVLERRFGELGTKLSLSHLLGNEVTYTQGGEILRRYDRGRTVSVAVTWTPVR